MSKTILPPNVRNVDAQLEELKKKMVAPKEETPKDSEKPTTLEDTSQEPATKTTPEQTPPQNNPQKDPDENTYKQKYSVLQGKYNKEVPRLQSELKSMQSQIEEVNSKYATLLESQKNPPSTTITKSDASLVAKIREEYGDDLAEGIDAMVEAKSTAIATKLFQEWENRANDKFGKIEQHSAQARQNSFFADLTKTCPDWKSVVKSDDWNDWLGNEDDDGETFQAKVDKAMNDFNVKTVGYVLGKFKALMGEGSSPSLSSMAAPNKTTNTPPIETKKEIFTGSEIRGFEMKRLQGKFRSKPSEEKQLTEKYELALREGRVDFSK